LKDDYSGWENAKDFVQNLSVHDFSGQFSKFEKYVSWVFENSINDSVSYGELADKSKIKRFADGIVKVINQDHEGLDFHD